MTSLSTLIKRNLFDIFNQRDESKRRACIEELWADAGVLWSAEGTYAGRRAIDNAVDVLLKRYPEYDFSLARQVDEIPEAARLHWSFGILGTAPALSGMDVVKASNGRITAMYRFLDGAGL